MSSKIKAQKKAIRQNITRMASDIFDELKAQLNAAPLKHRIKFAWLILRGKF